MKKGLLAASSGILLALSFPKFGNGALAWVALAPLLVALAESRAGLDSFRLGYVTGAVSSVGIVYWTALVVVQYGGLSLPVGIGVMGLLCLALALFPSLFGWMVGAWCRAFGPAALMLAPVAWVATEILRAFLEEGDRKFLLWQRQQRNGEGRKPGAAEVGEGVEGGGMDKASMSTRLRDA